MNLAWTRKWLDDGFNQANLAGLLALYSPAVKFRDMTLGVESEGLDGIRHFVGMLLDPKAGAHQMKPEAYLGDARSGVAEWTWSGTMGDADFLRLGGSFKGKTFKVRGNSVLRFDDAGLIVEERDYWDLATLTRHLGLPLSGISGG